jgi:hypothetical protein
VLRLMAQDDDRQVIEATELWQKLDAMVVAVDEVKKKAIAVRTCVLVTAMLLEQEQHATTALDEVAQDVVRLIEVSTPPSTTAPDGSSSSNTDDYEATVITNLHVQAFDVQNILSPVSVLLDASSMHYAHWRDNVLLTLWRYALSDHVLSDDTFVAVFAWDRMDMLVKSWLYDTISPEIQDVTRQRDHTAHAA